MAKSRRQSFDSLTLTSRQPERTDNSGLYETNSKGCVKGMSEKSNVRVIGLKTDKKVPAWARDYPWVTIGRCAQVYHVDANLVAAIIKVESNGHQYVTRFEPKINRYWEAGRFAKANGQTVETERKMQASSYGYCQLLGRTARMLGFTQPLGMLYNVDINIDLACKLIKDIRFRYQEETDIIAAYNAGAARKDGPKYLNQTYVNKVTRALEDLRSG